jgi:hypothetical protein
MSDDEFTVSASVRSTDEAAIARAAEVLARAASGLALEGITVHVMIYKGELEDEADQ